MTERLKTHTFEPQKANRNACEQCPYMAANPIHRRAQAPTMIRGTAHPNKLG